MASLLKEIQQGKALKAVERSQAVPHAGKDSLPAKPQPAGGMFGVVAMLAAGAPKLRKTNSSLLKDGEGGLSDSCITLALF